MKYRKIAKLGKGGMAVVTLAVARGPAGFNKLLVLKELRKELSDDAEFVNMFLDEARVSARLQHPNIVHTYDVVSEEQDHYLVMEYLQGQPLSKVRALFNWNGLPLDLHLRILSDALAGLHYAHEATGIDGQPLNIVHRDVSPQNVFVGFDGQVKLLDFGVAKARGALSATATGIIKGKLAYMAPEALLSNPIDRRADVFSMGVMLWEALAKRKINKDRTDVEVTGARVSGREPKVTSVAPDARPELVAICERAMEADPAARYQTAREFKEALDKHIGPSADSAALASFLSEAFAEERERMQRLVQEYLESADDEGSIPSLRNTISESSGQVVIEHSGLNVATRAERSVERRRSPVPYVVAAVVAIGVIVAVVRFWPQPTDAGAAATSVHSAPSLPIATVTQVQNINLRAFAPSQSSSEIRAVAGASATKRTPRRAFAYFSAWNGQSVKSVPPTRSGLRIRDGSRGSFSPRKRSVFSAAFMVVPSSNSLSSGAGSRVHRKVPRGKSCRAGG